MNDLGRRLLERAPAPLSERLRRLPPVRSALVAVLLLVLVIALVDGGNDEETGAPAGSATAAPAAEPPQIPPRVAGAMERMAVEDKLAQLFLFGFEGTDADAPIFSRLRRMSIGGLVLASDNYRNRGQLDRLTNEARDVAKRARHVPPWMMAAQQGGEFSAFPDLPPEKTPAETESAAEAAEAARDAARELRALGVNGIVAPVLDVAPEAEGALPGQTYSDSAEDVTDYARATVDAYDRAGIFAAAEHFPGLGGASQPPEIGPANVGLSVAELEQRDLRPFRAAIDAGVPGIVVGPGLYATDDFVTPASLSRAVITGLLRDELGFEGVVISDDLSAPAVTATIPTPEAAVGALNAGADMIYVSRREADQEAAYRAALNAVRKGDLAVARIDEALARVLIAKDDFRLLQ